MIKIDTFLETFFKALKEFKKKIVPCWCPNIQGGLTQLSMSKQKQTFLHCELKSAL